MNSPKHDEGNVSVLQRCQTPRCLNPGTHLFVLTTGTVANYCCACFATKREERDRQHEANLHESFKNLIDMGLLVQAGMETDPHTGGLVPTWRAAERKELDEEGQRIYDRMMKQKRLDTQ